MEIPLDLIACKRYADFQVFADFQHWQAVVHQLQEERARGASSCGEGDWLVP